jgi:5-methyltetrahydrofolate--homocysteine methyltransferase
MLDQIITDKLLIANGIYGFWPAASDDDEVILYTDESRTAELCRFHMLRQQWKRRGQSEFRSLADYVAPKTSGRQDYIGGFAVTAGLGAQPLADRYTAAHDDVRAIMVKALADRLAEAFAEKCHLDARRAWGYGRDESCSPGQLIDEQYRGIRPAHGYPACPDHTEKRTLFDLMDVETNVGIELTENFAMRPAASVSGLYFAHPQARYFAVDRIARDQVADYAKRKGFSVAEIERWLSPNLGYEPG